MISRSCISAISTGIAYFHSKRSAMYAEITSSEAMIAMIALLATVLPKVGPIEVSEVFVPGRSPKAERSAPSSTDLGRLLPA